MSLVVSCRLLCRATCCVALVATLVVSWRRSDLVAAQESATIDAMLAKVSPGTQTQDTSLGVLYELVC